MHWRGSKVLGSVLLLVGRGKQTAIAMNSMRAKRTFFISTVDWYESRPPSGTRFELRNRVEARSSFVDGNSAEL